VTFVSVASLHTASRFFRLQCVLSLMSSRSAITGLAALS